MAEEILTDGVVNVYRPDREELVGIMNGAWNYEKVLEYAEGADERMDVLYNKSKLRHSPDMKKISELDILVGCREIISNYFIIQEFSNNKISLYQKVIYNKLIKLIEEKKKK